MAYFTWWDWRNQCETSVRLSSLWMKN